MAEDPWHEAKRDVEALVSHAASLLDTYARQRRQRAPADDVSWTRDELDATLTALDGDVDDLEASIAVVEQGGSRRFGIEEQELDRRKRFVAQTRREITRLRHAGDTVSPAVTAAATEPYRDDPDADLEGGDPHEGFERMQQTMIMQEQDRTLTSISGVIGTLREQAGVIGHEVLDQVGMLTHLESDVDQSSSRLERANRRMQDFIKQNSQSRSSWCICLLIVILVVLLFAIIII